MLSRRQELVLRDVGGGKDAMQRFLLAVRGRTPRLDIAPLEHEADQIDSIVLALMAGLDLANLPLINDKLT